MAPASRPVCPGVLTSVLANNRIVPDPTIRMKKGGQSTAENDNGFPAQNLVIHWHGLLASAAADGNPRQEVPPATRTGSVSISCRGRHSAGSMIIRTTSRSTCGIGRQSRANQSCAAHTLNEQN